MTDQELHDEYCVNGMLDNCASTQEEHAKENLCDSCNDMEFCLIGDPCPICHPKQIRKYRGDRRGLLFLLIFPLYAVVDYLIELFL